MRMLATAAAIVLLVGSAWAQAPAGGRGGPPPTPTNLTKGTAMTDAELHAMMIAKVGNDRASVSNRVFTLAGQMPYTVNVEHRTNQAQGAAIHNAEAELFYVIDGSATMVTGGTLVGGTTNGANVAGTSIDGGVSTKLGKGDFLIVPKGVPHWFSQIDVARR